VLSSLSMILIFFSIEAAEPPFVSDFFVWIKYFRTVGIARSLAHAILFSRYFPWISLCSLVSSFFAACPARETSINDICFNRSDCRANKNFREDY